MREVNWRIVDRNGKTKVYHRNGLMQAGQRKEPTVEPPLAAIDPGTCVNNPVCNSPIITIETPQVQRPSITTEEENPQTETLNTILESTLDMRTFRDNVLTDRAEDVLGSTRANDLDDLPPTPPTPPITTPPPTSTRSGRISIPVKRLIDEM